MNAVFLAEEPRRRDRRRDCRFPGVLAGENTEELLLLLMDDGDLIYKSNIIIGQCFQMDESEMFWVAYLGLFVAAI